jgi:hypothetical protein
LLFFFHKVGLNTSIINLQKESVGNIEEAYSVGHDWGNAILLNGDDGLPNAELLVGKWLIEDAENGVVADTIGLFVADHDLVDPELRDIFFDGLTV